MAAAAWAGTGTGTAPPAAFSRPPASKRAVPPAKSDSEIERDIRARLAKSKIAPDKFQVHVQGGVATLEGKTDVIQHKGVATRLAKSGGAVAVKNQIQISDSARQKAAQNLETGRRRAQLKRSEPRSEAATAGPSR
jgi:osmotically-inducible protein OsmY